MKINMELKGTSRGFQSGVRLNFLSALVGHASHAPLEAGTEYSFKCFTGSGAPKGGYTWEKGVASQRDLELVAKAIRENDLGRFDPR